MSSFLTAALARAQGFLLEPATEPAAERQNRVVAAVVPADPIRVAVLGLGHRCGVTTVARGLALALALSGTRSVHLLSLAGAEGAASAGREIGGGHVTRWEVPLALRKPSEVAEYGATVERLAAGTPATVWDVAAGETDRASAVISSCDRVVAVVASSAEPALAALVCEMLGERYGAVLLVANRVRDREGWERHSAAALPESRLGALLTGRGRMPGGGLGVALRRLAASVGEGS